MRHYWKPAGRDGVYRCIHCRALKRQVPVYAARSKIKRVISAVCKVWEFSRDEGRHWKWLRVKHPMPPCQPKQLCVRS